MKKYLEKMVHENNLTVRKTKRFLDCMLSNIPTLGIGREILSVGHGLIFVLSKFLVFGAVFFFSIKLNAEFQFSTKNTPKKSAPAAGF